MGQAEHPHGGPPGQRPREEEGHPLGGPPGQEDKPDKPEKPDEETDPDAPHPDQTLPGDLPPDEPADDAEKAPA